MPPQIQKAYVKQEDVFYSQLTVRETLLMAARLRLPRSMSLEDKTAMVDELLSKLGLSKVGWADRRAVRVGSKPGVFLGLVSARIRRRSSFDLFRAPCDACQPPILCLCLCLCASVVLKLSVYCLYHE